jgi:hypothetical protein
MMKAALERFVERVRAEFSRGGMNVNPEQVEMRSLFSRSKAVKCQECDDAGFGLARQESLRSSGYVSTLCHPPVDMAARLYVEFLNTIAASPYRACCPHHKCH